MAPTFSSKPRGKAVSGKSNVSLLTEGASYFKRAKKAREDRVEKIVFDDDARREWLTGFSKRKKAKVDERRAKAKARDHQEHLEERRKARQELRQRALDNVKSVRKAMGLDELSDQEEAPHGAPAEGSPQIEEQEEEFSDDEQQAIVTIVEDFDPSQHASTSTSRLGGTSASPADSAARKPAVPLLPASSRKQQKKAAASAALSAAEKLAIKRKQRREQDSSFETKGERRKMKEMEKKRKLQKADLARERDGGGGRGGGGGGRGGGGKRGGGRGGKGGKRGGRGGKR